MIRILDIILSLFSFCILFPLIFILFIGGYFDTGSPLFLQKRIGRNFKPFYLVKFRTMSKDTLSLATHLADASAITSYGKFLRKTKLDEIPQLWNVFKGEMSLVGPRPNLFNQVELIKTRKKFDIYIVRPGVTGLAQIKGIDMSTPGLLAKTDAEMISSMSLVNYFKYIALTLIGKGQGDRVHR